MKSDATVQNSTEAVKQSIKQDPNVIGFISYSNMGSNVKTLSVGCVSPANKTISDGSYELQRFFILLVKGTLNSIMKEFINWVMSPEESKILSEEKIVKSSNN